MNVVTWPRLWEICSTAPCVALGLFQRASKDEGAEERCGRFLLQGGAAEAHTAALAAAHNVGMLSVCHIPGNDPCRAKPRSRTLECPWQRTFGRPKAFAWRSEARRGPCRRRLCDTTVVLCALGSLQSFLKGSWYLVTRVIIRVTILITPIRVLITSLTKSHDAPYRTLLETL